MKIAITGAGGYIGSFLQKELEADKDYDLVYLSTTKEAGLFKIISYESESLKQVLQGTDVLIHLAAIKKVASFEDAMENISMTRPLIDAACLAGVKQVIYASSISVYSDEALLPWPETIAEKPSTLYGMSKLMSEHVIRIRCRNTGTSYTSLRLAHIIGDHMPGNYMMPTFFRKAALGEDITIMGRTSAKREFVHVEDICRVIHACIDNPAVRDQTINVGCGSGISNEEVAAIISDLCPASQVKIVEKGGAAITSSYMDIGKLRKLSLPQPCDCADAVRRICRRIELARQQS